MTRVLFVASEAYPLIKTGGLADVAGSLPPQLEKLGADVRLLMPAYQDALQQLADTPQVIADTTLAGEPVRLLQATLPGTSVKTWLLDHASFAQREGNPYHDSHGAPWPDNAARFTLLSRAAAAIAGGETTLDWQPQVVHCNDWHTGPAIALVSGQERPPLTVFTIHNLAHMGLFDYPTFERLRLPQHWWQDGSVEFYGQCSFMKAGLSYADVITTVSPTYAREICESPGGMGLEGLLSERRERLVGIINGIDQSVWNPAADPCIESAYDAQSLDDKARNKAALQSAMGLEVNANLPLLGFVGRLAEQKGLALMLPAVRELLAMPAQLVVLGTGDPVYEQQLAELSAAHPDRMAVTLAYNETLAHRIEAGADIFLMPSLFEPCGLNQLYSLRYGTPPLVRAVGGLADTVTDANAMTLVDGRATGFVFSEPTAQDFLATVRRALQLWQDKPAWRAIQRNAMRQDFSWHRSAAQYMELYRSQSQS